MSHYAALDVSNEQTAIHVIDEAGRTVWRGKRASDPEALAEVSLCGSASGLLVPSGERRFGAMPGAWPC
jgi:hypothetical protein